MVGFVGVLVISWPKLTLLSAPGAMEQREVLGVVIVLLSAAVSAVAITLVRRLVHTERTATIVLWFSLTASAASLATLPFGWSALTPAQAAMLVCAGFCGGAGQMLMTEAYRHAELSMVAPFEYSSMLLGVALGYLIFGEGPTAYVLVGGAIVIASGLVIIWRERRLNLARIKARELAGT